MKTLAQQMSFYHRYHTKLITKITHLIGVPMILLGLMMPLSWLSFSIHGEASWNLMWLSLSILSIYYLFLAWRLALGMIIIFLLMGAIAIAWATPYPNWHATFTALALFVLGWMIQFIGHVFEKRKPALFDNIFQIFIAPIFLLAEVLFMLGYLPKLKAQVLKIDN